MYQTGDMMTAAKGYWNDLIHYAFTSIPSRTLLCYYILFLQFSIEPISHPSCFQFIVNLFFLCGFILSYHLFVLFSYFDTFVYMYFEESGSLDSL